MVVGMITITVLEVIQQKEAERDHVDFHGGNGGFLDGVGGLGAIIEGEKEDKVGGGLVTTLDGSEYFSARNSEVRNYEVGFGIIGEKETACVDFYGGDVGYINRGGGSRAMIKETKEVIKDRGEGGLVAALGG